MFYTALDGRDGKCNVTNYQHMPRDGVHACSMAESILLNNYRQNEDAVVRLDKLRTEAKPDKQVIYYGIFKVFYF